MADYKPSKKLKEVAFGAREALGIEQPQEDIQREVSYTPPGDLAYEIARLKGTSKEIPQPPEGLPLNTQEDVNKYLEFAKKFPELASKALPKFSDTMQSKPSSSPYRNPQYVAPDQRQEALRKIREQQIYDPAAELIKRKLGE